MGDLRQLDVRDRGDGGARRRRLEQRHLAKGRVFGGEMALLESSPRGATVTAITDIELLEITHKDFDQLCQENPLLGYRVLRNMASQLSGRLRRSNQDVVKLSSALSLALSRR